MTDPIESRLSRYFAQMRPNASIPAEVRLVAALDRADAERTMGWNPARFFHMNLGKKAQWLALGAVATAVVVAVGGSLGLAASHPAGTGGSPSAIQPSGSEPASTASPISSQLAQSTNPPATGPDAIQPRMAATVRLADGQVLMIAGARDPSQDPPSAGLVTPLLWNPKTGTYVHTGAMLRSSSFYSAVLLRDGRVLVAGSRLVASAVWLTDAELYDPTTRTFSETGLMIDPIGFVPPVRLLDGRVLLLGYAGYPGQIYDPESGKFTSTGLPGDFDAATGKFGPSTGSLNGFEPQSAALLADGRVLVSGSVRLSVPGQEGYVTRAQIYDPKAGAFICVGSGIIAPGQTVLLTNERVLVVGGQAAEIYDPATGETTATGKMTKAAQVAYARTATTLKDGRVLVGMEPGGDWFEPVPAQVYDPRTNTFSDTGPMPTDSGTGAGTLLADGRVLIAAGDFPSSAHSSIGWLYDPKTNAFSAVAR